MGGPPSSGAVLMTHCNKLLQWYPAFAGRYTAAWGKAYGPCKESEIDPGTHRLRKWLKVHMGDTLADMSGYTIPSL